MHSLLALLAPVVGTASVALLGLMPAPAREWPASMAHTPAFRAAATSSSIQHTNDQAAQPPRVLWSLLHPADTTTPIAGFEKPSDLSNPAYPPRCAAAHPRPVPSWRSYSRLPPPRPPRPAPRPPRAAAGARSPRPRAARSCRARMHGVAACQLSYWLGYLCMLLLCGCLHHACIAARGSNAAARGGHALRTSRGRLGIKRGSILAPRCRTRPPARTTASTASATACYSLAAAPAGRGGAGCRRGGCELRGVTQSVCSALPAGHRV